MIVILIQWTFGIPRIEVGKAQFRWDLKWGTNKKNWIYLEMRSFALAAAESGKTNPIVSICARVCVLNRNLLEEKWKKGKTKFGGYFIIHISFVFVTHGGVRERKANTNQTNKQQCLTTRCCCGSAECRPFTTEGIATSAFFPNAATVVSVYFSPVANGPFFFSRQSVRSLF